MRATILGDARVWYKPQTQDEIEAAVHDMAARGYLPLVIAHALTLRIDTVTALLALDACE